MVVVEQIIKKERKGRERQERGGEKGGKRRGKGEKREREMPII